MNFSKTLLAAGFAGMLMTGAAFAADTGSNNDGGSSGNGTGTSAVGSGAASSTNGTSANGANSPGVGTHGASANCNAGSTSQQNAMTGKATGEGCNNN